MYEKIVPTPEEKGFLISLGIIMLGNAIKPKNRDVGNMVQGFGFGTGIGTIAHCIDQEYKSPGPHHDVVALVSLPVILIADKTNIIENKDLANNLFGMGLGILTEHLLAEGCSFCNTVYCKNGQSLC